MIIPRTTTQAVKKETSVKVAFKNSWVSLRLSSESPLARYFLKVGIKATEIAFSAKRRRKRLGIIKAVAKAAAYIDVPRKEAFVISRTSPMMREAKVMRVRTRPERTMDFEFLDIR